MAPRPAPLRPTTGANTNAPDDNPKTLPPYCRQHSGLPEASQRPPKGFTQGSRRAPRGLPEGYHHGSAAPNNRRKQKGARRQPKVCRLTVQLCILSEGCQRALRGISHASQRAVSRRVHAERFQGGPIGHRHPSEASHRCLRGLPTASLRALRGL